MARVDRTSRRQNPRYQKKLSQRLKRQQVIDLTAVVTGETSISPNISNIGNLENILDSYNLNDISLSGAVSAVGTLSGSKDKLALYAETSGGTATTNTVTVTASGGTSPYTYAWTKKSGDTLTVNSPTSNATTFSGTPGAGNAFISTYTCTITDSAGSPATFDVDIAITITDIS